MHFEKFDHFLFKLLQKCAFEYDKILPFKSFAFPLFEDCLCEETLYKNDFA